MGPMASKLTTRPLRVARFFTPTTKETFLILSNSKSSINSELSRIKATLGHCVTTPQEENCILTDSQAALLLQQTNQIFLQDNTNISTTTKTSSTTDVNTVPMDPQPCKY
jgi:hypothetical protein